MLPTRLPADVDRSKHSVYEGNILCFLQSISSTPLNYITRDANAFHVLEIKVDASRALWT